MPTPTDIVHSRGRNTVTITWDDAVASVLPVGYLRGWCPCAVCQGHGTRVRYQAPAHDVTIDGLYEMGAYAIAIRFSDGHDSGIYTWAWLRSISPETEPLGLKFGSFDGPTYAPPGSRRGPG